MSEKKTKPRIMVADDDPFIVELYRAKLTRERAQGSVRTL